MEAEYCGARIWIGGLGGKAAVSAVAAFWMWGVMHSAGAQTEGALGVTN